MASARGVGCVVRWEWWGAHYVCVAPGWCFVMAAFRGFADTCVAGKPVPEPKRCKRRAGNGARGDGSEAGPRTAIVVECKSMTLATSDDA